MEDKQENSLELEGLIKRPEHRQPDKIEPSPLDSSFNDRKREESERREQDKLAKIIEDGDIDDISDILTPKTLTESRNKNALIVAMETSFDLRRLACEKGPSEEDFISLANSVDQFSSRLLDPLKSDTEARHAFGDSIDEVMDAAINLEQKQLLAHPVLYDLMTDKWLGKFRKLRTPSWFSFQRCKWIFLNIWCLFDCMCPLLFLLFCAWNKYLSTEQKLKKREMEVAFLMNTTSKIAVKAFDLMKETVEKFIVAYGDEKDNYRILIHGSQSGSDLMEIPAKKVKNLQKGTAEFPALHENLQRADERFFKSSEKSFDKVIIFFTDHKTSLTREFEDVKRQVKDMGQKVKLLPVGIGLYVDIKELQEIAKINNQGLGVIHVTEFQKPERLREIIWHELQGKTAYETYLEYFRTPYFVFVRDTLSYLALLTLHFAICLTPSSVPLSGLEWAILVFFLGRILMEIQQFMAIKKKRNESKSTGRSPVGKYLRDRWNVLDVITLVIYLPTLVLRIISWALSTSATNNRAIVIAGYLYGVNTMVLTLRAFGHVMETKKGVGPIQIALFQIFGDIATIIWQFVAAILAFSISITKVYMAERSYVSKESHREGLVCETPGFSCWWTMITHLCWSLLGIAELEPLDSIDHTSVTIAHLLFGAFLVLGVILLINMMIALLSNTYQRVQDNSLREWCFKKAITIQTYSDYHPVPVPFNIIWCIWLFFRKCYQGCVGGCRSGRVSIANDGNSKNSDGQGSSLNSVVRKLQMTYFARYGNAFPVGDDCKMNHIFQETKRNQQMANQIAYETFTPNALDKGRKNGKNRKQEKKK